MTGNVTEHQPVSKTQPLEIAALEARLHGLIMGVCEGYNKLSPGEPFLLVCHDLGSISELPPRAYLAIKNDNAPALDPLRIGDYDAIVLPHAKCVKYQQGKIESHASPLEIHAGNIGCESGIYFGEQGIHDWIVSFDDRVGSPKGLDNKAKCILSTALFRMVAMLKFKVQTDRLRAVFALPKEWVKRKIAILATISSWAAGPVSIQRRAKPHVDDLLLSGFPLGGIIVCVGNLRRRQATEDVDGMFAVLYPDLKH